ncbi:MAG: hypothetical protein HZB14_00415 [Actinobacteria bacterium]|nr:hypothetical protein [Actinomycetota bacterium]
MQLQRAGERCPQACGEDVAVEEQRLMLEVEEVARQRARGDFALFGAG